MFKAIPNAITLSNLFAGCISIMLLSQSYQLPIFYWMGFALLADLLDGAIARKLNATSAMGKELDSLADMVSFGFFPGLIYFHLLSKSLESYTTNIQILAYAGFIITLASAIRLAKFNTEAQQKDTFKGIPTPANTIWALGLLYIIEERATSEPSIWEHPVFLFSSLLISCYLLNAKLSFFSLKFSGFRWEGNEIRWIFVLVSILMLTFVQLKAVYWLMWLYLLISILFYGKKQFSPK